MLRCISLLVLSFACTYLFGQSNLVYADLPVGKYAVGFRIIRLADSSRVSKPEYNYLGEKNIGDRSRQLLIHLWYPAKAGSSKRILTYGDYCYNHLLSSTSEQITNTQKEAEVNARKRSVEGWFGKPADEAWSRLIATPMLARTEAEPVNEKFPLLIGMLRPLSTSVTNEVLASNGYVVAMIKGEPSASFAESALREIPDMQQAISFLGKQTNVDKTNTGTFGFSGSGFTQVLFAMHDFRVKALADIESGIYMDNLFQGLSTSNYYRPAKLRVPFLHIFSLDLSKQEKFIGEFEEKTRFAKRYRLLLNQPALHHWDFASEGYTASLLLGNRGNDHHRIAQSFQIATMYLVNFFNAELKTDTKAAAFMVNRPALNKYSNDLWDMKIYNAVKPAPDRDEFEHIVRTKGIEEAVKIVNNTIRYDSSSNILRGFVLNAMGYNFLNDGKHKEAIGIFKLNTELHPDDANLFDSLAEGYETSGDKENSKKTSAVVMDLLNRKNSLTDAEKALKRTAEERLKL